MLSDKDKKRFEGFRSRFDITRVPNVNVFSLDVAIVLCPRPSCNVRMVFVIHADGRLVDVDIVFDRGSSCFGIHASNSSLTDRIRGYLKCLGVVCCPACLTVFHPVIKRQVATVIRPPPVPTKRDQKKRKVFVPPVLPSMKKR